MSTSFEFVKEIFEGVFQQALADKGTAYMESQKAGYMATSLGELTNVMPFGSEVLGRAADCIVGPEGGSPVAWVYDPSGLGLVQVNGGASENELLTLAGRFYGYEL